MVAILSIESLQPEMVLSEPVTNKNRQTLFPVGMVLLEKHIALLKTWGINSVVVKLEDDAEIEISEDVRNLMSESIMSRMQWIPQTEIERDLFEITVRAASQKYIKKANGSVVQ